MSRTKVLIVDDEHNFTDIVKINLEATGDFEVTVENNSINAFNTARSVQPDVILLDIVMPGLDGGDVLGRFQRDKTLKDVPVILLTALVSPEDSGGQEISQSGGQVMLAKPVSTEKLVQCIKDKLAGKI